MPSQLAVMLFLLTLFTPCSYAFSKLNGEFFAGESCPAWLSFKKKTNPGEQVINIGQRYPLLGENKLGGFWLQIKLPDGSSRWVEKKCGRVQSVGQSRVDFYTLSLSWQPTFCAMKGKSRIECRSKTKNIVLHGLWPSVFKGKHPAYCGGEVKRAACDYPALGLQQQQLQHLAQLMPAVQSCQQRYQWHKHGVCSGMNASDYFSLAADYTNWFLQSAVARQFEKYAGQEVALQKVVDWFKQWGGGHGVSLHCGNHNGKSVFRELRLYLKDELPAQPTHTAIISAPVSHQCPNRFLLVQ